ncbi:MAG: hypothetical protein WBX11_16335 [Thiobacillaceae bacterium]
MARFQNCNCDQGRLLPISFSRRFFPGSFACTHDPIFIQELDRSMFAARHDNDRPATPACDPAMPLKLVLHAGARA